MQSIQLEHLQVKSIPLFSDLEQRLFNIFEPTVKEDLKLSDIQNRYKATYQVDLFFLKQKQQDVGFAMITFYKTKHQGRTIYFARPAMGILNSARGAKFPMQKYIEAFIQFKLRHPFSQVILFTLPVNPIPYAASSKYWIDSFPKYNRSYPKSIEAIKKTALQYFGMKEIRENVVQLPFGPLLDEKDIQRYYERKKENPHVAYYLTHNPNFLKNESLILIMPVNLRNITYILTNQLQAIFSSQKGKKIDNSIQKGRSIAKLV